MAKSILITGGARSGKSALAERRALSGCGRAVYIATAPAPQDDAEMADRIARHAARRGPDWDLCEEPLALTEALRRTDPQGLPRLVDCLTLWLSNLMLSEADWSDAVGRLCAALPDLAAPVVFVTNEVGSGIVPATALGRRFRDAAGEVNRRVAETCDEVWLAVAGQPLQIKPARHPF